MWLRLRQIALVAQKLPPVESDLIEVMGLKVCYRDPGVGYFGLQNALFPIGNQLLEVVAPVQDDTAGGRYLERRGGDGGYMVITQCDEHLPRRKRVESLGVRLAHQFETDEFRNMQLHPKDTGATFFEIDEQLGERAHEPDGPWEPAGPNWQAARVDHMQGILAAELQCDNPISVGARWAEISDLPLSPEGEIVLDNATLRFVECRDGRPEGLGGIDVATSDAAGILQRAEAKGLRFGDAQIQICGTRINLIEGESS
ncbi:MAG: hypothetical protein AAF541_19335 [Pseudomonadota bacterium]